jgi:hypothetical protein
VRTPSLNIFLVFHHLVICVLGVYVLAHIEDDLYAKLKMPWFISYTVHTPESNENITAFIEWRTDMFYIPISVVWQPYWSIQNWHNLQADPTLCDVLCFVCAVLR